MESQGEEGLTVDQVLKNLQQTEDVGIRYYAAWWLGKFRVRTPEVLAALLVALEDEVDRTPDGGYPLRRNAARALGKVGDRHCVPALTRCLDCPDYYVREAAAQSLELLGDSSCVSALVKFLEGGPEMAVAVPGKPHLVQPYEAIIEALGTLQAKEAITIIEPFLNHSVPKIKFAAARALYQLTKNPVYGERLVEGLKADSLPLRRSALMDLGSIGYLGAAEAISKTLAENSLKLVSLKGLLEIHLRETGKEELTEESIELMGLMDALL